VMSRPRNERGVISPYPTVVIAMAVNILKHLVKWAKGMYSLTRTNQAAAGMD